MATLAQLKQYRNHPNVHKFLDLISYTEGTQKNGYHTAFGGGRLAHLNDHPRYLKSFNQTDKKSNKTSAAGRYQFLRGTWDGLAKQYGFKDFGAENQDLGAIALLVQNGAMPHLLRGDFNQAIAKSGATWASLPTSPHPQPTVSWEKVNAFLGKKSNHTSQQSNTLFFGDSIAHGYRGANKADGITKVGANPKQILKQIDDYLAKNDVKGKTIVLSSGLSNGNDLKAIEQQLQRLNNKGANVQLLGVSDSFNLGNRNGKAMNDSLSNLANKYGVHFYGGFKAGKDNVHPASYKDFKIMNASMPSDSYQTSNYQTDTITDRQIAQLYARYANGGMNDMQRREYEADVKAGLIGLPANVSLKQPKKQIETLPLSVLMAYNDGRMTPQQMADLEHDVKAGIVQAPKGFELKNPKNKGFLEQSKDKVNALGNQITNQSLLDTVIGGADTVVMVGGGLFNEINKGLSGIAGGIKGSLQGKNFVDSGVDAMNHYENNTLVGRGLSALATPRTPTAEKVGDVLNIYPEFAHLVGEKTYDLTGNAEAATTVEVGLNGLAFASPFKKRGKATTPETVVNATDNVARQADNTQYTAQANNTQHHTATQADSVVKKQAHDVARQADNTQYTATHHEVVRLSDNFTNNTDRFTRQADDVNTNTNRQNQHHDTQNTANEQNFGQHQNTASGSHGGNDGGNGANNTSGLGGMDDGIPPNTPRATIEQLLDTETARPKTGGVDIDLQVLRNDVLKRLGFADDKIRQGSITGDITRLEQDKTVSKLDVEHGRKMREQLDHEFKVMDDYINGIFNDIGASRGLAPESRGQVVLDVLQKYKDWYREQVKADYKKANEIAEKQGGITLSELQQALENHSNWQGKSSNSNLRKGIYSYLKEQGLVIKNPETKKLDLQPMTAKQAEGLRQYINDQWSHESAGLIGKIKNMIDNDVFKVLDENAYTNARKRHQHYQQMFNNPNGIAKLLDIDGINHKVSAEQVGKYLQQLAVKDGKQFQHIYSMLDNLPDNLKVDGKRAKAEIQASILEALLGKKSANAIAKEYAHLRKRDSNGNHKANAIFGDDIVAKIDDMVAGKNILQHHDPNPSGTAATTHNLNNAWNSPENIASASAGVATGTALGGVVGGVVGAGVGLAGKFLHDKIKTKLTESQARQHYEQSLNAQRSKVYREANDKLVDNVINTNEMKAIIDEFEKSVPNETKIKVLQRKLQDTQAWKAYIKSLPEKTKKAMGNIDILDWITKGATSHQDDEIFKPKF